ncbi:MAG TPA: CHAT domain-containing tetratricopeptide repeat protein [Herpetosiphonaceae bacterium]
MTDAPDTLTDLAAPLIALPAHRQADWIAAHRQALGLSLIEALKQWSDAHITSDPPAAEAVTRSALLVAEHCPQEPLALALAAWARGNWEAFNDPQAAVQSYRRAIDGYQRVDDLLSVARLLSNLIFAYTDCGRLDEAEAAYGEARAIFQQIGTPATLYLQALEQNYGWLLHNQGRYAEALEAYLRAVVLAHQLDRLDIAAEVQVNRAYTLGMLGRLAEGARALEQERAVAEEYGQTLTVARIDMDLGELYAAQGRPAEALRSLHAARTQFAQLGNTMEVASVLLREAALFERIGALRTALRSYAQAQTQFEALDMQSQIGTVLLRRAAATRLYGMFRQATQLLDQAALLWQTLSQPVWQTIVVFERVALALAQGAIDESFRLLGQIGSIADHPALEAQRDMLCAEVHRLSWAASDATISRDQARQAYLRALSYARQHGERWMQREALAGLGRLALPDDPGTARQYLEAAVEQDDITRVALGIEELKAGFQAHTNDLLPLLAVLAIREQQPLQALVYAWRAKGSALLELLMARESSQPVEQQADVEQLRQQLANQRWLAARQATGDRPAYLREHDDPQIKELEQRIFEARRERQHSSAQLRADVLLDPRGLAQQMDADVLLEYIRHEDEILAVRVERAGACQALRLASVDELLDLHDELALSMQNVLLHPEGRRQHSAAWLAETRPLLERCYRLLIAPLEPLPDDTRLLVAACDPLYLLPFAAFWDGQRYLAERCTIEMIPSGVLLAVPPPVAPTEAPLVIAASADGALAAIAEEAAAICATLPESRCLVDHPQTLATLSSLTVAPRLLHIAAHMVLRADAPIFSALRLPDGLLSVEQCYDLPLAGTELVVLSGCSTAAGQDSGGALLAFQSALFVAGARRILSSLWPIEDHATGVLMAHFYRLLADGFTPAAALRQTQQILIAHPTYGHPALWATFTCSRR